MIKRKIFISLVCAWIFVIQNSGRCQENDKIVILSVRVGPVIDATEREHFNLFSSIAEFYQATIFQTPGKKYFVRIVLVFSGGRKRDTTIQYSEAYLLALSEFVDHFEEFTSSRYQLGTSKPSLHVIGGEEVARVGAPDQRAKVPIDDLLPYAKDLGTKNLELYPKWGFGIGLSTPPDFSGLDEAFTAIERRYQRQGYYVAAHKSFSEGSRFLWYDLQLRFSNTLSLLLEVGSSMSENATLKGISGMVLYHLEAFSESFFRPYAGFGIGSYSFSVENTYGSRISQVDTNGGYLILDVISTKGGTTGPLVLCGFDVVWKVQIGVYGSYLLVPPLDKLLKGGETATLRMSKFIFGGRIAAYF